MRAEKAFIYYCFGVVWFSCVDFIFLWRLKLIKGRLKWGLKPVSDGLFCVCQFLKKNIDLILYIVFYWYNMR